MNLQILAEAKAEIEAAEFYLDEQVSELGERFLVDLRSTLDAIVQRPESFPKLETLPRRATYRRALLKTFSYAVIFDTIKNSVVVVAITHTSRKPNYWLNRVR